MIVRVIMMSSWDMVVFAVENPRWLPLGWRILLLGPGAVTEGHPRWVKWAIVEGFSKSSRLVVAVTLHKLLLVMNHLPCFLLDQASKTGGGWHEPKPARIWAISKLSDICWNGRRQGDSRLTEPILKMLGSDCVVSFFFLATQWRKIVPMFGCRAQSPAVWVNDNDYGIDNCLANRYVGILTRVETE